MAELAIGEVRDATACLKVQLTRVKAETRRLEEQTAILAEDERRWVERARRVAAKDEDRALSCLRRRQDCRQSLDVIADQLGKSRELEKKLQSDLGRLKARLQEIDHRRRELRGRELTAKGAVVVAGFERDSRLDVDRLFERWEVEIARREIGSEMQLEDGDGDGLAEDFERAERDAELRDELAAILKEEGR